MQVDEIIYENGLHLKPNYAGHSQDLRPRIKGGVEVPSLVVRIYVEKKCDHHSSGGCSLGMADEDHFPPVLDIAAVEEGGHYQTDIVEIGELKAPPSLGGASATEAMAAQIVAPANAAKTRPVQMGFSLGHYSVTAGSSGFVAWVDGEAMILTNNHVAANSSSKNHPRAKKGDPILQPGKFDGGTWSLQDAGDVVATLYDWVPFDETGSNVADISVGRPLTDAEVLLPPAALAPRLACALHDQGYYVGRTSGFKQVSVMDPAASLLVGYEFFKLQFTDVVLFTPTALPGDSGSGLYFQDGSPWMNVFAGSQAAGVACKLSNTIAALNALGHTVSFTPPPPPLPAHVVGLSNFIEGGGPPRPHPPPFRRGDPVTIHATQTNDGGQDFAGTHTVVVHNPFGQTRFFVQEPCTLAAGGMTRESIFPMPNNVYDPGQSTFVSLLDMVGIWNAVYFLLDGSGSPLNGPGFTIQFQVS